MEGRFRVVAAFKKSVWVLLLALAIITCFTAVTTKAEPPKISALNPASNATVNSSNFGISFLVTDAVENINDSNFFIKLDGKVIPSSLQYKGHWEWDYDNNYWVIDSYKEATVSAWVTGAQDGLRGIEVQAMNASGATITQAWNVTVAVKPVFSNMSPPNQAETANNQGFSIAVSDNTAIDPQTISAELDSSPVTVNYNSATGVISYSGVIPDGLRKVKVTAADRAGNTAVQEWEFTVCTKGPDMSFPDSEKTLKVSQAQLSVNLHSLVRILNTDTTMTLDGQSVAANFSYKGHWEYNYGDEYYVVDSYKDGTLNYFAPLLTDGIHQIGVSSKDALGNTSSQTWYFNVAQPPIFLNTQPLSGEIVVVNPVIKAQIQDPNGNIDPAGVRLSIDDQAVYPDLQNNNGVITLNYTATNISDDRNHTVSISAADLAGNVKTSAWTFFASAIGPETGFSRRSPADLSEAAAIPQISVHFTDLNKVYDMPKATFSLDNGNVVKPVVKGKDTEYILTYEPTTLTDGSHTVTVTVPALVSGIPAQSTTWSFLIKIPPVITKTYPIDTITNGTPVLSAYATDNTRLDRAEFNLDGQIFTANIDARFNRVSVQAPSLDQGPHNVVLTVFDPLGNQVSREWTFAIDTNTGPNRPEMPVSSNTACWQCHQREYTLGGHATPTNCLRCHTPDLTKKAEFQNCMGCHYDNTYRTRRHATDTTWVWDNLPNRQHPVSDIHLSTTTNCIECHSRILTNEHSGTDRKDKNGNPITCDTCHTNTYLATQSTEKATRVMAAITDKKTDCSSCHEQVGHAEIHATALDTKCANCHNSNLQGEHMGNSTTAGKEYTCNTCHASTDSQVTRAIRNNQVGCNGCHKTAHAVTLSDIVPSDIPLYPKYSFSKPIEADIFAGDQGLPANFATNYQSGLVLISNRIDVKAADVLDYYQAELAAKGWELNASTTMSNSTYFTAEFTKYGRFLTVRCYNTPFGDNTGPAGSGYRVDMWYR